MALLFSLTSRKQDGAALAQCLMMMIMFYVHCQRSVQEAIFYECSKCKGVEVVLMDGHVAEFDYQPMIFPKP